VTSVVRGPKVWWMPTTDRPQHVKAIVGARLRVVRAALGLLGKEMATLVGVSPQTLSGWERGEDLADPLGIARAALRLGFTTDWVYLGRLDGVARELANEIERRRPDLVLGADPAAQPHDRWDKPGDREAVYATGSP
jgi:transcriptional regulator with XRE-family HTH domain